MNINALGLPVIDKTIHKYICTSRHTTKDEDPEKDTEDKEAKRWNEQQEQQFPRLKSCKDNKHSV